MSSAYETRTPHSDHHTSPPTSHMMSSYQLPPRTSKIYEIRFRKILIFFIGGKVKVKLQRIPPGTKWKQAKIDIVDSLFAFYVANYDPKVHDKFSAMLEDLQ